MLTQGVRRQVAFLAILLASSAVLAGSAAAADSVVGVGNCILANGGNVQRPADRRSSSATATGRRTTGC